MVVFVGELPWSKKNLLRKRKQHLEEEERKKLHWKCVLWRLEHLLKMLLIEKQDFEE